MLGLGSARRQQAREPGCGGIGVIKGSTASQLFPLEFGVPHAGMSPNISGCQKRCDPVIHACHGAAAAGSGFVQASEPIVRADEAQVLLGCLVIAVRPSGFATCNMFLRPVFMYCT